MLLLCGCSLQELYAGISDELELVEAKLNDLGITTGGYIFAEICHFIICYFLPILLQNESHLGFRR